MLAFYNDDLYDANDKEVLNIKEFLPLFEPMHYGKDSTATRILFQDSSFPQRESTSTKGSEKDSWTKAQTSTIKSLTKDCSGMTLVAAMVQHVVFKDTPGCQKLHLTSFVCSFDVTLKWMLAVQDVVEA